MASVPFVSSSPQDDGSPPQADWSSSVLRTARPTESIRRAPQRQRMPIVDA